MPTATCTCGKLTNSSVSNYWDAKDWKPTECYASFVDEKWVKGCAFDKAAPWLQNYVTKIVFEDNK